MAASAPSQFSVTVWPGGIIEPGRIYRHPEARLLSGGWIDPGPAWEWVEAPDELYLRQARDTDLSDPEALLDVVRTVGGMPLGDNARDFASPDWYAHGWRRFSAGRDLPVGQQPTTAAALGMWHVAEVGWRLRVLDVCGRVVVAYRAGDHVAPVWLEQANEGEVERLRSIRPRARRDAEVWRLWNDDYMNPALERWHVRAVISTGERGHVLDERVPTLLEVGALQIMNDLAREADYHVCANETCGRVFARQVGGGEAFNRRTGVRYCSGACKNAQGQREHRRRVKARKEAAR